MDEFLRKIVHLFVGIWISLIILLVEKELTIKLFSLAIIVGLIWSETLIRGFHIPLISSIIDRLERQEVIPGKGALFFVVSALICTIFFPSRVAFIAILVLSILDSTATIVGKRFGRMRIYNKKSIEGALSGSLITATVLLIFLPIPLSILISVFAGFVELISPIDDNLLIPVVVCMLLYFFQ